MGSGSGVAAVCEVAPLLCTGFRGRPRGRFYGVIRPRSMMWPPHTPVYSLCWIA